MKESQKLFFIRTVHTTIYLIMATSVVFILVAGIVGYAGPFLLVSLVLVGSEVVVFVGNGFRCPLTALARKYGAEKGYVFDTFLPEALTKQTFRFFGFLLVIGLLVLARRVFG